MQQPLSSDPEFVELRKLPPLTLVTMAESFILSRLEKTACVDLLNADQRMERHGLEVLAVMLRAAHEGLAGGGAPRPGS